MDKDIFQWRGLKKCFNLLNIGSYISGNDIEMDIHCSLSNFVDENKLFHVVKNETITVRLQVFKIREVD